MIAWMLALGVARADPADALDPAARRWWTEGVRLEEEGRLADAAVRYRLVLKADPAWSEGVLALGRVLDAEGRGDEAERTWARLPYDADCLEALGRHELADGRPAEATDTFRRLRTLRPEWPRTRLLQALALAPTDAAGASALIVEYLDSIASADPAEDGLVEATTEVAQALRRAGEPELAADLLDRVQSADPPTEGALGALGAEVAVDLEAAALELGVDVPLTPDEAERVRGARVSLAAGDVDGARRTLEVLVVEQPLSAVAWSSLADVRLAAKDPVGAEEALLAAEELDPRSAEHPARLGALLGEWYGGSRDADAEQAWTRAVRRRPEDPELWYQRAQAERRVGSWSLAAFCWRKVLELAPDGPHADEARRAVAGASLPPAVAPSLPSAPGRPASVPESAWHAYHRALAWHERLETDAPDRALRELADARARAPDFVPALDLEATIRADRGELAAAASLLGRALELDRGRGDLAWRLAGLDDRLDRAEDGRRFRERAAALGDPDALWDRARREASAWRWWSARATLAEFFAHATGGAAWDEAKALDDELVLRIRAAITVAGVGGATALLVPIVVVGWRRGGATLAELVERSPQSWREVATTCSTLRHEVLKHHLSVVDAVADALDDRDPEPARWAADRWFGPDGALARLDACVEELVACGRRAQVPINPRRDPILGPMLAATRRLRALEPQLRAGHGRALAEELRAAGAALGRDGYRALGRLLDELCLLDVDQELVREVYDRAAAEFTEGAAPEAEVVAPDEALVVRMFRSELADVLTNLVRNAIEANPPGGRVALRVRVDEDLVTGLERVEIRVADEAPGRLTTATLRSRWLSRGLGIAVDLVGRAGGSITVEPEPGYAKAVVVRLPRVERAASSEEDA